MSGVRDEFRLLPPSALVRTGPFDHADWNYRPVLGSVLRIRLRMVRALLDNRRYERLLEIGYGSGILMPELAQVADDLYGIDPHPKRHEVQAALAAHGVNANLYTGTAESLPFRDRFFDCVVAVSTLEYVEDIHQARRELARVLETGGALIVVMPGASPLWDFALKLSTGESADQYGNRRQQLLPSLQGCFKLDRELAAPPFGGSLLRLYTGARLIRA